ncbi:MAG: PHD-zinc-finger like domain-containing protein [Benniella sp.]|nr:MAG: PHD-zinc-finger like domain-containing protein [Benniella sp.]
MPKASSPRRIARMDTQPLIHTNTSSRRRARKGRHRSHRKGRPSGSGLRVRIKQQVSLAALEQVLADHENTHSEHTNHSLLANHPTSARHDYSADDENKPREERSYIEFYPFLDTTLKLDIVSISLAQSVNTEVTHVSGPDDSATNNHHASVHENEECHDSIDPAAGRSSKKSHPMNLLAADKVGKLSTSTVIKESQNRSSSATMLKLKASTALLPESSFRLIPRGDSDLEEYHLPAGHNMRYIEPTETELAERVEYDMDEQDEFWLKQINVERREHNQGKISPPLFEKIIDRLEKEWFDLTKNIPKSVENLPPEDSACNICDDGECENSNAIVFCDGCNLAVHQDCYGIPYIPEGQWLCRKCMLSPQMPVSCIFCPAEGGAFKQTTNSRWAHLLCASWIPEVGVANTVYMEPIDNIDKIPASRWKLTCYICKLRMGACIQCDTKNCSKAFHVTCARRAHLYMTSQLSKVSSSEEQVLIYRAHCHKHKPRDYKANIDIAGAAAVIDNKRIKKRKARVMEDGNGDLDYGRNDKGGRSIRRDKSSRSNRMTPKAALAHQKHCTLGAPLVPTLIVNRLLPLVSKLRSKASALRKVSALNFIYTICKYWSLKRESRRGAPLLKRLHLEPWTASASAHRQTEEGKSKKLRTQLVLREDLEKIRILAELVKKREKAKLKRQELQSRYLCEIMFPLKTVLEDTLAELER